MAVALDHGQPAVELQDGFGALANEGPLALGPERYDVQRSLLRRWWRWWSRAASYVTASRLRATQDAYPSRGVLHTVPSVPAGSLTHTVRDRSARKVECAVRKRACAAHRSKGDFRASPDVTSGHQPSLHRTSRISMRPAPTACPFSDQLRAAGASARRPAGPCPCARRRRGSPCLPIPR